MLQLRVFWVANVAFTRFFLSRISQLRAFWGGIFGRNLSEILRNTQNFGRNSEEKIGHWSLCYDVQNLGTRWEYKVEVQLCSFLLRGRQGGKVGLLGGRGGGHDDLVGDVGRGGDRRARSASLMASLTVKITLNMNFVFFTRCCLFQL